MRLGDLELRPWEPQGWRLEARGGSWACFQADGIPLCLEAFGPRILRLRLGEERPDYGLLQANPWGELRLAWGTDWLEAHSGDAGLALALNPLRLTFSLRGRPILTSATDGHIRGGPRLPSLAQGPGVWAASFALEGGEPVFGLGEKFSSLNRRGGLFTGWNEDAWGVNTERSYKNVPFAWSPRGWGLFAHSLARTLHGVGYPPWSHRSYVLVCEEEGLDLFFLAGSPEEILGAYASLTGFPPPVPRWSYGVWWSRCYYRTPEEALGVAKELRRRGMPGDVLVLDGRAWLDVETRCTLDWDGRRYPDPEGFLRELRRLGFRVCLWEYPYVSVHNPLFRELEAQGFFLRDGQGKAYVYHWDPEPFGELLTPLPPSGILDFTKEEVVRWWKERHQRLFALGVDVMKTDFGEQVPADALAANGDTGRRLHNAYALLYNRAVYEATPERLVFARSGFAGSQRYPVHWGGDPQADWEGLGASIRGGLSWGLSGGAYYAHDIGGFYGTPTAELYVRWLQAGVFFSHLRFHGTSPREPWHFGPEAEALVRAWLRLRMRLVPYVEKSALSLVPMGLPLARALPLAFPEDPWALGFDHEFLLGEGLLVAPVVQPGGRIEVYLPPGRWYDLWTGKAYKGPELLRLQVGLEQLPLFARDGLLLPLGSPAPRAEEVGLEGFLAVGKARVPEGAPLLGRIPGGPTLWELLSQ